MAICPFCGINSSFNASCLHLSLNGLDKNILLQGRYELISQLGKGGMGTVYLAYDLHLHNRACVVKKLKDDFYLEADKQKAIEFFQREANVLSQLQHPNIVRILDYFEENHSYFLVMEYVEGQDLEKILEKQVVPFNEEQVRTWAIQICNVLTYLHEHTPPVIYRDLKPSNIMLDKSNQIKLVDFGIARPITQDAETHVVSAGFSPPEQYWGDSDPRSDIYALGSTMYFLLTGKEPIPLHSAKLRLANPSISQSMDLIVQQATNQIKYDRFQTAKQMQQCLVEYNFHHKKHKYVYDFVIGLTAIVLAVGGYFAYLELNKLINISNSFFIAAKETKNKDANIKNSH